MKKTIQHGVTYMTKSAPNWISRTSRGTTTAGLIDARPSECEILPVNHAAPVIV
ncbi:hypothetical cytosolic protein [Coxiella burnetii CbuG_Q212]|nr:hypothetical cytosolic protein [Coxiella burnetii CbuG_Q212]